MTDTHLPRQRLLTVSEKGAQIRELSVNGDKTELATVATFNDVQEAIWAPNGTRFALQRTTVPNAKTFDAVIYDSTTLDLIETITATRPIRRMAFSPQGTFFMYCIARENKETEKNFFCHQIGFSAPIANFALKDYTEHWPNFIITDGETYAARRANDGILVYVMPMSGRSDEVKHVALCNEDPVPRPEAGSSIDLGSHFAKFATEKTPLCFSISNETRNAESDVSQCYVATYARSTKGAKSLGRLNVASTSRPDYQITSTMINAEGGNIAFTDDSTMAIFEAKLQQDNSNCSYYGNSTLHAVGATNARKIDLVNAMNAPVHEYQIRPGTSQVMVSYGPLPAKLRLLDGRIGKELGNFGENRRNHFRFSPTADWLLMGGYGALNGDTEIYNLSNGQVIGAARLVDNVVADWFPDGKHIVLATTSPRLRVDNNLRVMRYNGEVLLEEKYTCLTQVLLKPISLALAKVHYPTTAPTHEALKNVVEGKQSYIPPAMRRKLEAEAKNKPKAKGKGKGKTTGGTIKAQGANAKMSAGVKTPAIPEKKDDTPKMGFKLPF